MQFKLRAVLRLILVDTLGSVVWFPFWWYTTGLSHVLSFGLRAIHFRAQSYSIGIWIRHLFVPMYGQYDVMGRIVSVFMRLVVIAARIVALGVESLAYLALLVLWSVSLPLFFFLMFQGIVRSSLSSSFI